MGDIIDRKPPVPVNQTNSSKVTSNLASLIPIRPFGEVLESSYNDERSGDSQSSDERSDRDHDDNTESVQDRGVAEQTSGKRSASGSGPARLGSIAGKKQDLHQQAGSAHGDVIAFADTQRDPAVLKNFGVDGKSAPRGTSAKSGAVTTPTMLGAEHAMKQLEQMPALTSAKTLPPEVLNQLVAHVSTLYAGDQKQVFIRFQNGAVGGNLSARIHRDEDGATVVAFEGDSEVLASLESHQDELKGALGKRGMRPVLRFV